MKKIKSILKSIVEAIIAIPVMILITLVLAVMLPFDYIKYKRSPYYKKERKKYSLLALLASRAET